MRLHYTLMVILAWVFVGTIFCWMVYVVVITPLVETIAAFLPH